MPKNYWLVKQEPGSYSWDTFVKDGRTAWSGVRNFQARNYLRAMSKGDLVLFYHSGDEKQVVGIARVAEGPYADPTAKEGNWSAVDLEAIKPLQQPVTLAVIKASPAFEDFLLVRNSRLSVMPIAAPQFRELLKLSATKI